MCGLVGYAGRKNAELVLMVALESLEYRGYDSSGIAVLDKGDLSVLKEQGKIKALEELLKEKPITGNLGIAHTRWATHGEPSRVNAHPHTNKSQDLAVVHNGIIENFQELKTELQSQGYIFQSETDTEVLPHLIDRELRKGVSLYQAIQNIFQMLKGKYALAIVSEKEPDKIFFAQDGAPLLIGKGVDEFLIASDISALVRNCEEIHYLKSKEWGFIQKNKIEIFDFAGNSVPPKYQKHVIKWEDVSKGGFPHFMLKEIYEQPDIMRRIIEKRIKPNYELDFSEINISKDILSKVTRFIIQAAGTSLHAGMVGKYYLEHFTRIQTDTEMSSEFRYRNPVVEGDTMVIAISQSGETADTLAGIHEAKSKFIRVLSLVNNINSTIARESDGFLDTGAGLEIGVASTKAFTSQLLNLYLFSIYIASLKWMISEEDKKRFLDEVKKLPDQMADVLKKSNLVEMWCHDYVDKKDFVFLGRSYNHPIALEGALKLKEISYIHASGYAGGEFKHGPIALITEQVPVVCITTKSEIYRKMLSNIQEVKARKGMVISIITEGETEAKVLSDYYFEMPDCIELLSPILNVVPLQLLAYYTAVFRGCEPDQPRNLAKAVTVE